MPDPTTIEKLADNVWLARYPLHLVGCRVGRNVTIIRLASGRLVIHSTAPFTPDDVAAIVRLGTPGWLVDATRFHDTFASAGRAAFPGIPYLAPPAFPSRVATTDLLPPPPEWDGELEVVALEGMPGVREHAFHHHPSRTLVVADLLFNLEATGWTRWFLGTFAGLGPKPGMSRFFRFMIKDRNAFRASLDRLRALPFERVVVAHGRPIKVEAARVVDQAFAAAGF